MHKEQERRQNEVNEIITVFDVFRLEVEPDQAKSRR